VNSDVIEKVHGGQYYLALAAAASYFQEKAFLAVVSA
jgi:hypothetical protein